MNRSEMSIHIVQGRTFSLSLIAGLALYFCLALQVTFADGYESPQGIDWYYTTRPNDTLKSVAEKLLGPKHSWVDLAHFNHIKDINVIPLGSIIKIPIAWLTHQPQPATPSAIEGVALLKRRHDTSYSVLDSNDKIFVGDELITRDGTVMVTFADDSTLTLGKDSKIIFNKLSHFGQTGMVDTRLRLDKGGLETKVSPLTRGSRYEVSTPSAAAAVRGTQFRLRTNNDGTTLEVLEGSVEFSHAHGKQMIPAGSGARIYAQSATLQTKNLLTSPVGLKEKNAHQQTDALAWQPIPSTTNSRSNARGANSELSAQDNKLSSNNESYALLTTNNQHSISEDKATLKFPLPGSILDAFSAEFSWDLKHPTTLSKLELSPQENFETQTLALKWSRKHETRLESDLMPGNYYWRVRSLSDDKTESVSATRSVSIQGRIETVKIVTINYLDDHVGIYWHSVANSTGYALQISDDNEFRSIMKEQTLEKTSAYIKISPNKRYYARVKGLGNEVFDSEFGPATEIYLAKKADQ